MAVRFNALMTVGVTALLTAGCSLMSFGRSEPQAQAPQALAPVPAGSVTGVALPPPGTTVATGVPMATGATMAPGTTMAPGPMAADTTMPGTPGLPPATGTPTEVAVLDPSMQTPAATPVAATAGGVGRTDLLGGWTISAAGDSCQLFMTLTTWAGGYRASTRGCNSASLQTISAWNMEGGQVQLLNDSGTTVARLYPASKTQFSGQTDGGGPISVTR